MSTINGKRVLAIGIDAAEPSLIQELIRNGGMPVLKSLLDNGRWLRVKSPSNVGSGSVWPSFITGLGPSVHGVYGEWCWRPETMSLARYSGRGLNPFWRDLADEGISVGLLDVPFARLVGINEGFEITEWGPHDCLDGVMQAGPDAVQSLIQRQAAHPLAVDRLDSAGPSDHGSLETISTGCLEGIRARGDLAQLLLSKTKPQFSLIVFTEIHHAAHYLWHKLEPQNRIYTNNSQFKDLVDTQPDLKQLYEEVDRQIGKLLESVDEDSRVLVFSLHGMQATHGIPAFLQPVLIESGFAKLASWKTKSSRERALALLAFVKRQTPPGLKKLYYKSVSQATAHRMAQATMLPSYDWERTCAFSLPSDQHGWIRINLSGREVQGRVPPEQYERQCDELEALLTGLQDEGGNPLVRRIIRTAPGGKEALSNRLPDIIAHWNDAAFASSLRIKGFEIDTAAIGTKFTGQHQLEGFCIAQVADEPAGDQIQATEFGGLIASWLRTRNFRQAIGE